MKCLKKNFVFKGSFGKFLHIVGVNNSNLINFYDNLNTKNIFLFDNKYEIEVAQEIYKKYLLKKIFICPNKDKNLYNNFIIKYI